MIGWDSGEMRFSDDDHLQGKISVQYITIIVLSAIQKTMMEQNLYRSYTIYSLLDVLDVIEYYEYDGRFLCLYVENVIVEKLQNIMEYLYRRFLWIMKRKG